MLRKKWRKWMFSAIFLLIVATLFCISTIAATTVKPISGVEVTDSVGTGSLSGTTVTITAKGGLSSTQTNTVTIENASGNAATLNFKYSVTGNYDSYTTPSGNTSGTYSATLPAGGSVTITIVSKTLYRTATLTLSEFSLTATAASSIVGFAYDTTLGSVTVDGTVVANGANAEINGTTGASLVATPVSGATFVGWVDASNNKLIATSATYALIPAGNMSVQAAFASASSNAWFWVPDGSDKYLYNNLNTACTKASSTSDKTVILAANGTLPALDNNQSYTIPSGVTLLIPYNSAYTLHTTKPATTDATHVTPSAYRTLTMASGANLTVKGSLSLSGTVSAKFGSNGRPHGPLGYIKMNSGSSITVDGNLYAWGYIYGSGSVTVNSGATVYECFQIMDYRGGDGTTQVVNKKDTYHVFPMSQYYVQNIEVPLTLHAGAKEYGFMAVTVTLAGIQTAEVPFIGASGESVMFQVSKGYLTKDYDETADRLIVDVYGDVNLNSYSISIKVSLVGSITIDSADYVLPVTQNLTVNVKSGSNLAISQDIALLPEAEVNIEAGAKCTLASGKKIVVYDLDDWAGYCGSTSKPFFSLPYAPGRAKPTVSVRGELTKDATLLVNGTLDVSEGALYTTAAGANICSTGAGEIIFVPGTETVVYQAEQSDTEVTGWPAISIVPAWLNHGDGSYLKTGETGNGAGTYYYNKDHKKWVKDGHTFDEGVVTTAPTCTATGTKTYTCKCGYTKTETVAAIDHSYNAVVTAPTCSNDGYTTYTCTVCGDSYTDAAVEALGHNYETVTVDATCTTDGYTTYTCTVCGDSYVDDEVAALGHSYESETVDATCTENGSTIYTCTVCGDSYSETIVAAGHSYNTVVTSPTCTEDGYTTYTCTVCGDTYNDNTVAALGHTEVTDAAVAATCTTAGKTEGKHCSVCGTVTVAQTEVPALGHDYDAVVTAPTCTESGYTTYTCSTCGDSYVDGEVSALGHSYDDGVVTKDPTCYFEGVKTYTCTGCGGKYTETVAATGHSFTEWTKMTSPWNGFYTICEGCELQYRAELEYRLDDYVWLNLMVYGGGPGDEFGLFENSYEYISYETGFHFFLRQINAKDISTPFTIRFTCDGQEMPVLNVSFATYKALLEDLYEYELALESTTDTRRATIAKMQTLLEKMVAYGEAAVIYFDEDKREKYNADETISFPTQITLTGATDVAMGFTQGAATGVTGASLKTASAKVYFDEALRMSVFFKPTLPTGFDTKNIVKIGLLATSGTGTLTMANHETMYVLYSPTPPGTLGGSGNYPEEGFRETVNGTITDYSELPDVDEKGRWELCFDLTNDMYNQVYELRPFMIVEDETGTDYVYGEQVHYSLAAYISRTYEKADNAFKNLLTATWDYVVAAEAAF